MPENTHPNVDLIVLTEPEDAFLEEDLVERTAPSIENPWKRGESDLFTPFEPKSFEELGVSPTFLEHMILKQIMAMPGLSGRDIARALCVNPSLVLPLLAGLKRRLLVIHAVAELSGADFHFDLSEAGRKYAREIRALSPYVGPVPVPFDAYQESVFLQSLNRESIGPQDLERAFSDLVVDPELLSLLGPAMASGRGVFLFGNSGNGKTSLAMRMGKAYLHRVYLPHAIVVEGQVIQLFDPQVHKAVRISASEVDPMGPRKDARWVFCERPTVIAGGELTLDSLELQEDPESGVCEAPLQLKANCGLLVIDDFGRQRVDPEALLNRWILPLENRVDFLRLPSGRKIQVPFDPFLVFSTNLDPGDLVDEAFLRRIPYKVEVPDPTPAVFRKILRAEAESMGFVVDEDGFNDLVRIVFKKPGRSMRYCHPRDLLLQIRNRCRYLDQPLVLSREGITLAAKGYFTLL
jgi:DNA-binding MarR family transcriptional regulator